MARTVPSAVTSAIAASGHQCDWTLDLTFPNLNAFYYATSQGGPFNGLNGHNYSNDLERVSQIRQTIDSPADQVQVAIQNKDRILGQYLAANWQQFRQADAILGRYYWNDVRGSIGWMEMFRGDVQQPNADDFNVTFNVVIDTVSAANMVGVRTLNPICGFRFKDPKTCAYAGGLTTCNHHLASPGGCDGRANSHHYGGTEHRYPPIASVPGTGDNIDDDGGDVNHNPCPRLDQFVRARGEDGRPISKAVCFVTEDDWLWHPIKQTFNKVRRARIVKDQLLWEIKTNKRISGFAAVTHPIIRDASDAKGTPAARLKRGDHFLVDCPDNGLMAMECLRSRTAGVGDVLQITLDSDDPADQIYCFGDRADSPMIACHNRKDDRLID